MKKIKVEGYLFKTSGAEHGETVMKWVGEWDQKKYELVEKKSWCNNNFRYSYDDSGETDYDDEKPTATEVFEKTDLVPGKRYKITVEEVL